MVNSFFQSIYIFNYRLEVEMGSSNGSPQIFERRFTKDGLQQNMETRSFVEIMLSGVKV